MRVRAPGSEQDHVLGFQIGLAEKACEDGTGLNTVRRVQHFQESREVGIGHVREGAAQKIAGHFGLPGIGQQLACQTGETAVPVLGQFKLSADHILKNNQVGVGKHNAGGQPIGEHLAPEPIDRWPGVPVRGCSA